MSRKQFSIFKLVFVPCGILFHIRQCDRVAFQARSVHSTSHMEADGEMTEAEVDEATEALLARNATIINMLMRAAKRSQAYFS